jgi:ubiquinone biosynthesis monooxygenase Coq7
VSRKKHSAGLMRVNHVGEICAQALYDAQSAFSHTEEVTRQLQHSCIEEEDHLAWTASRLKELNSHTSFMNPLWYAGAYACGSSRQNVATQQVWDLSLKQNGRLKPIWPGI